MRLALLLPLSRAATSNQCSWHPCRFAALGFAGNVDSRTRQKMVRTFYPNHPRTDKLVNARNW